MWCAPITVYELNERLKFDVRVYAYFCSTSVVTERLFPIMNKNNNNKERFNRMLHICVADCAWNRVFQIIPLFFFKCLFQRKIFSLFFSFFFFFSSSFFEVVSWMNFIYPLWFACLLIGVMYPLVHFLRQWNTGSCGCVPWCPFDVSWTLKVVVGVSRTLIVVVVSLWRHWTLKVVVGVSRTLIVVVVSRGVSLTSWEHW